MSEKKRSFPVLAIVAAVALLGSAGAYFYLTGTFKRFTPLESAKVVPDDALLTAYIDTDSPGWSKLEQFGTPEAQAVIAQYIKNLETESLGNNQLDYQRDLKPWISTVTIAMLPLETQSQGEGEPKTTPPESTPPSPGETQSSAESPQQEPNLLILVGIKNKIRAWNFERNLRSQAGVQQEEIPYNGQTILKTTPSGSNPTYTTILGDHLAIAESQPTIEQAIDTYQGDSSLANKTEASNFLTKGADVQNPIAHIYIPNYSGMLQLLGSQQQNQSAVLDQIKGVQYAVFSAGVDEGGVRVRAIAKMDQELQQMVQPTNNKLVNRFPAETIALINGHQLNTLWSILVAQGQNEPSIKEFVDTLRVSFKQVTTLDIDQDIFAWMDGEFALGVISSREGMLAQLGFGSAIIFETSNRPAAEAALKKLEAIATQKLGLPGQLTITQRNIQNIQVTDWKSPLGNLGGHGWLDQNSLFLALGGPLVDVIAAPSSNTLPNSPNFKAIVGSLPTLNQGYFYLDMDQIVSLLSAMPLPPQNQIPAETQAVLNSIRGVGVTTAWPDSTTSQTEMLLALKSKAEASKK